MCYSHAQTAHSSGKPRAVTPSESRAPCPLPFPKRVDPGRKGGPASKRGRVPARGVLRPGWGQEAWEYHEPGPPRSRDPLHQLSRRLSIAPTCKFAKAMAVSEDLVGAHIPLPRDDPGFVQGTLNKPSCPWDKPRFAPYFTQWKTSLSQGQIAFVPGTTGVEGGTKCVCQEFMCFFSLQFVRGPNVAATIESVWVDRQEKVDGQILSTLDPTSQPLNLFFLCSRQGGV